MYKIFYKKGYKYKLEKDYNVDIKLFDCWANGKFIKIDKLGNLTILKGYAWDGASCAVDTKTFMRGSLIHDVLYQLIREGRLPVKARIEADEILIKICKEDGMSSLRRFCVYKAVRIFGGGAIKPRVVYTAP